MDLQTAHDDVFRTRVHAKVNLALGVGAVDVSNGLHPICSWMHGIDVCDEIEIRKVPEQQESVYTIGWAQHDDLDKPVGWAIEDDLGVRAHQVIEGYIGRRLPVHLCISKTIPAGGGLGGGSADAAGVLMGLNELFDLKIDLQTLRKLAMKLGSDIPFFLDPGHQSPRPAIVQGFGDQITRLSNGHIGTPITLIMPGFGCHTGKVYQAFDALVRSENLADGARIQALVSHGSIDEAALFNDLAEPAMIIAPQLGKIRESVQAATGQVVHVSGSGSTLFVVGKIDTCLAKEACPSCSVMETQLC